MTSFARFSFAFIFAGLAAAAPGHAQTGTTQTIVLPAAGNVSCPVAMQAQYGADGGLMAVRGGATHSGIGTPLRLTLNNPKPGEISAIRITFHGWDGTGRTLPAKSTAPAAETNSSYANATRTMDLTVSIGPQKSADTVVWVSGLTAVDSIDLDSVSYADGSNWEPRASQACRIVPDPKMLISNR